jgi:hypothetical protein
MQALVTTPVLIAPRSKTRSLGSREDTATPTNPISAATRPTDSRHTKGITIMSQTSQRLTGGQQQDPRTRQLQRLAEMVQAALDGHDDALTPETFRLLAALNRDSIELDGIGDIGAERMHELCGAFCLADFQIDAVLRAGAGSIGLFGPYGWADAPPVPVLAISPDGFDRSQVVPLSRRPGHLASTLAFIVQILDVKGDNNPSAAKTITLRYTQMASEQGFETTMFNANPSASDRWRLVHISSPQHASYDLHTA